MNFMVVRSPSPYNGIIGRPGVRKLQAVSLTAHGMLKLPEEGGVITLKSSRMVPLECAMKPADMTGVPRHITKHHINVREGCSRVRQKKRGQAADRNQEIQEEVGKLMEAGIMKEVHYHDWLSNSMMVKKHDDSWRMCVDFKDLNKPCLKDGYPLPEINWKVESLCGFPLKCFLDAYKGYHQIQMTKEDEGKTAFITCQGIFYYTKMPFGLRNAGATYQRLVDKAFHKQIDRNLEVYVNDLVIKSRMEDEIVRDIEETFKTLKEINMKLNHKKCTFRVEEGMFLGYKVNTKGLKVCPDKKSDFHWTAEVEEAFKKIKQLIAELPLLAAPIEKDKLIVYLAAAKETVNGVLMMERETKQMPIYFVSRALRGPEINYTSMEKFDATNNEAEYEALIVELRIAKQMGVKNLQASVDSRLEANQVNGTYVEKEADMIRYLKKVRTLTSSFKTFSIRQVPRSENKKADALSKIASMSFAHVSKQVLIEELKEKSIREVEILVVVEEEWDTWMTPIFEYLTEKTLLADVKKQEQ
uniref:Reverse transcriptase domain-containing protein n=1 Tax=Tanacetum cinerariifolium TaxID=118510 RepID=A0A699I8E8_TANCI|nr:reverse transcriptase domain-containing protein [Tanacetum cinerariifolium]